MQNIAEQAAATFSLRRLCSNSAVISVNSVLVGPQGSDFFSIFAVPVQNQPYCCDAPLEGNAKPPAGNSVKYLQTLIVEYSWTTSCNSLESLSIRLLEISLTYSYHINQPVN